MLCHHVWMHQIQYIRNVIIVFSHLSFCMHHLTCDCNVAGTYPSNVAGCDVHMHTAFTWPQVLSNLGAVISEVADAPASQTSAALELIRSQADAGAAAAGSPAKAAPKRREKGAQKDRATYIKGEFMHVWMQMQEEWHLLLSQLLNTPLRALGVRSTAFIKRQQGPGGPGILERPLGWLMKFDEFSEQVSSQVEAVLSGQMPGVKADGEVVGGTVVTGAGPTGRTTGAKPAANRFHFQLDVKVWSHAWF